MAFKIAFLLCLVVLAKGLPVYEPQFGVTPDLQASGEVLEERSEEIGQDPLLDVNLAALSRDIDNESVQLEETSTARQRRDVTGENCKRVVYRWKNRVHYIRWRCP